MALNEIEELFSRNIKPGMSKKASDVLLSNIINAYEAAVDEGIDPIDALSMIVGWVSTEMARVRFNQGAESC